MKANYIDGAWVATSAANININPSDIDDYIGEYASADEGQVRQAVAAAAAAFPEWAFRTSIQARSDALEKIASELLARRDELGNLLAREEGKTLPEAIAEVERAGRIFRFFGGEALRISGQQIDSVRNGINIEITREPVGVVGIITPWNFPIAIPAWKIAPALAYGNTVVFKPAEQVPGSAWALTEIISRAGLPQGVFNLVMGSGSVVGQMLSEHRDVQALSFTGSTLTGGRIIAATSKRFAKVQLEMGGSNPLLILGDADLDRALDCAVQGAYYSTGQRCTASSRLIVEKNILPSFVRGLKERLRQLVVDDARKYGTQIGPVANAEQFATNLEYLRIGRDEGAMLAFGGEPLTREKNGFYLRPALFTDVTSDMRIAREEVFGPIACVIPAENYEHALVIANDTEFGLAAGVCTSSLKYAAHFKRHVNAGMVMVNTPTAGVDYHVPFGGTKASSYGAREQGSYAKEFFTTIKTNYTST